MLTDAYLMAVARRAGVDPFWLDDAVNEMRIALWQAKPEVNSRTVARTTVLDFLRSLTHRGHMVCDYLDPQHDRESNDWTLTSDRVLDLAQAWPKLAPCMQRSLVRYALGFPSTHSYNLRGRNRLRGAA
jgi:DNA-directed RNA polymerase specialized sigma24 family protein